MPRAAIVVKIKGKPTKNTAGGSHVGLFFCRSGRLPWLLCESPVPGGLVVSDVEKKTHGKLYTWVTQIPAYLVVRSDSHFRSRGLTKSRSELVQQ